MEDTKCLTMKQVSSQPFRYRLLVLVLHAVIVVLPLFITFAESVFVLRKTSSPVCVCVCIYVFVSVFALLMQVLMLVSTHASTTSKKVVSSLRNLQHSKTVHRKYS